MEVVDDCVVHVRSAEGEILPLLAPLPMTDAAEQWLADLASALRTTLQVPFCVCVDVFVCVDARFEARFTQDGLSCILQRGPRVEEDPGQLLSLAGAIDFTQRVETALQQGRPDWSHLQAHLQGLLAQYAAPHWHTLPLMRAKTQNLVRSGG